MPRHRRTQNRGRGWARSPGTPPFLISSFFEYCSCVYWGLPNEGRPRWEIPSPETCQNTLDVIHHRFISHSGHSMVVSKRARATRLANVYPALQYVIFPMEYSGAVHDPLSPAPDPYYVSHSTISSWGRSIAMLLLLCLWGTSSPWRSKGSWRLSSASTSTTATTTTTTTTRYSSNRVRPGRVVQSNAVTNRSTLTFMVLERSWWRWCSHKVCIFSPVLAIQYPHVTS